MKTLPCESTVTAFGWFRLVEIAGPSLLEDVLPCPPAMV
jgi:N-acyl-L-homoserine lactone synthetase